MQTLKNVYRPLLILWPSSSTSSRTTWGPTNHPNQIDISSAPKGMATPSEMESIKSSQLAEKGRPEF